MGNPSKYFTNIIASQMLVALALLRNFSDQEAPGFGWPTFLL
jgi:hypothetical protein